MVLRHCLQPDRLPDSALGAVIHSAGLQGLLSATGRPLVGVIPDTHLQHIASGPDSFCHIKGKGQIAIAMSADSGSIPPDNAALIHRAEMKNESLPPGDFQIPDLFPVPEFLPGLEGSLHT